MMISYDEYLELARKDVKRSDDNLEIRGVVPNEERFLVAWRTGGMSGGSHWGGADRSIEPEPEPDMVELRELLDDLGLRLRQANEVLRLAVHDTHYESGYYENSTSWEYKYITLESLGEKLAEMGFVEAKPVPAP